MGGFGLEACQGFLVRETCVRVPLVELCLLSLEHNEVSSSEFGGVYGFGMTLDSLYFNAHVWVPVLLEN